MPHAITYARTETLASQRVCSDALPGTARCLVLIADDSARMQTSSARYAGGMNAPAPINAVQATAKVIAGYGPSDLQRAYGITSAAATNGDGVTIAVVSVYDALHLEDDLAAYRAHFGLPPCTSANRCFTKRGQSDAGALPQPDPSWAIESTLDVQMISANCPRCAILVIEANSSGADDLAAAVDIAARQHPRAIANSYAIAEWPGERSPAYAAAYDHPGIAIVAAAGDNGYGVNFPAAYASVIAVGGTSLIATTTNARGFAEVAWSGTGSGCSAYVAKPAWQHDTGCAMRTVADLAYAADPAYGVAMYTSTPLPSGRVGWLVAGGTSAGAPAIAALYGLGPSLGTNSAGARLYDNATHFFDITLGANGSCETPYACASGSGYDGPTGLGSPNGVTAF